MCDAASQIPIQNSEVCTSFEFPFLPIFSSLHFLRRQIGDWWRKFQRVVGLLPARLHWAEEYLPWWNFKRRQTVMGNYTIPRQTCYDEVVLNNLTLLHKSESTSLILFRRTSIESWEDKLTTPLIETCIPQETTVNYYAKTVALVLETSKQVPSMCWGSSTRPNMVLFRVVRGICLLRYVWTCRGCCMFVDLIGQQYSSPLLASKLTFWQKVSTLRSKFSFLASNKTFFKLCNIHDNVKTLQVIKTYYTPGWQTYINLKQQKQQSDDLCTFLVPLRPAIYMGLI